MAGLGDLASMAAIAGGAVTGSGLLMAGGALGGMMTDDSSGGSQDISSSINAILNKALSQSVNTMQNYTGQAVNQENTSLQNAINSITGATATATQQATNTMNQGLSTYQTLQGPSANQGYQALDTLSGTLGLATPVGGSANLVANQTQASSLAKQLAPMLQSMNGNYSAPTAPTAYTAIGASGLTPAQITQLQSQAAGQVEAWNAPGNSTANNIATRDQTLQYLQGNTGAYNSFWNSLPLLDQGESATQAAQNQQNIANNIGNIQNLATGDFNTDQSNLINSINTAGTNAYNTAFGQYTTQNNNYNQVNQLLGATANNPQLMALLANNLQGQL